MKYFLDTEFHEYSKQPKVLGFNVGKPIDTIELISIGIVSEDSRKYYEICNEFDLKAAWNNEWLRENVLKPIHYELMDMWIKDVQKAHKINKGLSKKYNDVFNKDSLKELIVIYGKSRKQIAEEIIEFCNYDFISDKYPDRPLLGYKGLTIEGSYKKESPEFYAYYADYDWVVFCWLFGKRSDINDPSRLVMPYGFPYYCKDLKQELDKKLESHGENDYFEYFHIKPGYVTLDMKLKVIKKREDYPKQTNEHNALADAKWNYELYKFIQKL